MGSLHRDTLRVPSGDTSAVCVCCLLRCFPWLQPVALRVCRRLVNDLPLVLLLKSLAGFDSPEASYTHVFISTTHTLTNFL